MPLARVDLGVTLVYAAGLFWLAQRVSRRPDHAGDRAAAYFLASRSLPWWAIGTSLIAANISAEQIIGMSGAGFALGLAIASYEWMAAATLLLVGKYFLPVFLENSITTMPEFLERRFGKRVRGLAAVFWLGLYVFVNLTTILWLGATAVRAMTGIGLPAALATLGGFALLYQLRGGLRAVALTDVVQVTLLVAGGALISAILLARISGGAGVIAGFHRLHAALPDHFHMILHRGDPHYRDLPGLSVLLGGLWVMNLSYWGFNQYIIQRALAARSLEHARAGVVLAAAIKLLTPFIIVVPGIAAAWLTPHLARPDMAYPAMMALLPVGLRGLVFAALVAAVIASAAAKINAIATLFAIDIYGGWLAPGAPPARLVRVGRIAAVLAVLAAATAAMPLLGHADQAFQFIQEYTGFFTPGIVVIFLLGLFWPPATEVGALAAILASFLLSVLLKLLLPSLAFMDRVGLVFVVALALAIGVSLAGLASPGAASVGEPAAAAAPIVVTQAAWRTSLGFNLGAAAVVAALVLFYATWW